MSVVDDVPGTVDGPRKRYEQLRATHLGAVGAAMEDHVGRLDWRRVRSTATKPKGREAY